MFTWRNETQNGNTNSPLGYLSINRAKVDPSLNLSISFSTSAYSSSSHMFKVSLSCLENSTILIVPDNFKTTRGFLIDETNYEEAASTTGSVPFFEIPVFTTGDSRCPVDDVTVSNVYFFND